ncbi:MAG: hypothetical protein HY318_08985 [Armatimonadetes bacterium]|nr:hypothetical protein [Armatimonadota bacterium]
MADQDAERLWEFVEQIKQGTATDPGDDPLLRLAQFTGEVVGEKLPTYENDRAFARERLAAVMDSEQTTTRERQKGRKGEGAITTVRPLTPLPILFYWLKRPVLVSASLLLLLCVAVFHWRFSQAPAIGASMLVKDHIELLGKKPFADFESSDATQVAFWLTHQVGFPVAAVDLSSSEVRLLGGRRCQIAGQPIGLSFYQLKTTRISLFQLKSGGCRLRGLSGVQINGRSFLVGADKGFNLVAWEGTDTLCVMVSSIDTATLLTMATAARDTKEVISR